MQPEVLPARLRRAYAFPLEIIVGTLYGVLFLTMSMALSVGFMWLATPEEEAEAPSFSLLSNEEPEMFIGYHGYNDGSSSFRNLEVWDGGYVTTLTDSTMVITTDGSMEVGNTSDDVHTFHGTLIITKTDEEGNTCEIELDPTNGIRQSCFSGEARR